MEKVKRIGYLALLLLASCGSGDKQARNEDTATSGTISISADEGLKPIVEAELAVFTSIYPDAHIRVIYTGETDAVDLLCKDSVRIAVVSRELYESEKEQFKKATITPRYSPLAYDGIALILNNKSTFNTFTQEQVAAILSGKISKWNQLDPKLGKDEIRLIFDNPNSGIARYFRDSVLAGHDLTAQAFAVQTNAAVIDQVEKDPHAIGLIASAWISDTDDSLSRSFTKRIQVASLVPANPELAEAPTMKPYQAYIALKQYPFWRSVQLISREARVGLGTGFASFIASDRGQRIVLKSGLVPAQAPVRLIKINNDEEE